MQFTVPNRALEEFDLYSIVRTTDPALEPITLADDSQSTMVAGDVASHPGVVALRAAVGALGAGSAGEPGETSTDTHR